MNGATGLAHGIHDSVPAADYHNDPAGRPSLSASLATVLLAQSPRHAWTQHPRLNPDHRQVEADQFDVGTAAHALLLQGEQIAHIVDAADWRTTAARDARDEARQAGLLPLLAGQWERVQAMVAAVRTQLEAHDADPPLFTAGRPEQTLVWDDSGVLCRARLDWLHDTHLAVDDFKSCGRSAHPREWTRHTMWAIGADIQAAFYLRGLRTVGGHDAAFRFAVAETTPPYAVSVISLSPEARALADSKVEDAIVTWRRCVEQNDWPAYTRRVAYAEPPAWVYTDAEARAAEQELAA